MPSRVSFCTRRHVHRPSLHRMSMEEAFGEVGMPLLSLLSLSLAGGGFKAYDWFLDHRKDAKDRGVVAVQPAGAKGLGLFATEPIPKNAFIGVYKGDHLTLLQLHRKYPKYDGTYVYSVRDDLDPISLHLVPLQTKTLDRAIHWGTKRFFTVSSPLNLLPLFLFLRSYLTTSTSMLPTSTPETLRDI